ncbi:hypothetical protein V6Z12_A08G073200 [Gossypium hirsutum]
MNPWLLNQGSKPSLHPKLLGLRVKESFLQNSRILSCRLRQQGHNGWKDSIVGISVHNIGAFIDHRQIWQMVTDSSYSIKMSKPSKNRMRSSAKTLMVLLNPLLLNTRCCKKS